MTDNQSSLKLQQFKCPSCGQNITQLTPFKASIECPYCHQVSLNPLVVDKSILVPERVIPFTVTQDDFGEDIIEALVDQPNLPLDLFDQITFGKVIKAYLPMYEYAGSFEGTWNCEEAYTVEHKRRVNGQVKVERETRYRPARGDAFGNFSILALAYSGGDIPPEFERYASAIKNPGANSYPFDPDLMGLNGDEQILTLEMNRDPRKVWAQTGNDYVKRLAEQACKNQAPKNRRNFRSSSRIEVDDDSNGIYTMVPFWLVYFFYEGQAWNFMSEGSGSWRHLSAPESNKVRFSRWGVVLACLVLGFLLGTILEQTDIWRLGMAIIGAVAGYFGFNFYTKQKRIEGACKAFPESKFAKQHK